MKCFYSVNGLTETNTFFKDIVIYWDSAAAQKLFWMQKIILLQDKPKYARVDIGRPKL